MKDNVKKFEDRLKPNLGKEVSKGLAKS